MALLTSSEPKENESLEFPNLAHIAKPNLIYVYTAIIHRFDRTRSAAQQSNMAQPDMVSSAALLVVDARYYSHHGAIHPVYNVFSTNSFCDDLTNSAFPPPK